MAHLWMYEAGRLVADTATEATFASREEYLLHLEAQRREAVRKRRRYYEGTQYDDRNAECLQELATDGAVEGSEKWQARAMMLWSQRLPEHLRLHEYSTQLAESVDFIAHRLAHKARVAVEDTTAAEVIGDCLDNSPELSGSDDEQDITLVNVTREALKVGDTPVLVRWDPLEGTCWLEFWDSEVPDMRFVEGRPDKLTQVIVEQVDWRVPPGEVEEKPVHIRRVWQVVPRIELEITPRMECVEEVWLIDHAGDSEPVLVDTIWWGVPFLPWWLLRGDKKSLRAVRGESLITDQAMKTADRFNAVEQVAWLIARYNSHSNLAVMGDAALLQGRTVTRIQKDVADVLPFPGGTNAVVLSLPTDPQMIEHQKEILLDGLYGSMGVTRVDQTSLQGMGGVTGYALEILNQKSDGTFGKVRSNLVRDWKKLLNLVLDCFAFWSQGAALAGEVPVEPSVEQALGAEVVVEGPGEVVDLAGIDPMAVFPNRTMDIVLGSGYVVDETKIRDDFVAKLISQQEALRERGMSEPEIDQIMEELAEQQQRAMEVQREAFGETGTEATRPFRGAPRGTSAGSTTETTARPA